MRATLSDLKGSFAFVYFSKYESHARSKIKIVQSRHSADMEKRRQTYDAMCFRSQDQNRQCDLQGTMFRVLNQR